MKRFALILTTALAVVLTLSVIMLGAYVRLSDAGLGCPDWPGCYGQLLAPDDPDAIAAANAAYPDRQVEPHKAWKEMAHRYLASTLGLMILVLAVGAWLGRRRGRELPIVLPLALVALVIFQGLLGMWTVTLLVKPLVVTAHLAGGLATLALLWWLLLGQLGEAMGPRTLSKGESDLARMRPWALGGLALLCLQILLGGWLSTNYAALACIEFPTCVDGQWWPRADFAEGFTLWRGLGVNYEFGVLQMDARTAIHLAHRVGALIVALYLGAFAILLYRGSITAYQRTLALVLLVALAVQLLLGITNVVAHLPLAVAVAHNGGAALLLLVLLTVIHSLAVLRREQTPIQEMSR